MNPQKAHLGLRDSLAFLRLGGRVRERTLFVAFVEKVVEGRGTGSLGGGVVGGP